MSRTRILIADDHAVVRRGLRVLLNSFSDFRVIAEAADGTEAVRLAARRKPDVILMDITMPGIDGIEATAQIIRKSPGAKIVILTVHEDEEYVERILNAGARGYVLKNAGRKEIATAVRAARSGDRYFSPGISRLIVDGFIKRSAPQPKTGARSDQRLTQRETEVLGYIAQGLTNKEIAEALYLSFRTVNTHRTNIMQKLDIHETAGLVRYAIRSGLLKPES
jgi:DNA-binding NarL/FixJ family response regulator